MAYRLAQMLVSEPPRSEPVDKVRVSPFEFYLHFGSHMIVLFPLSHSWGREEEESISEPPRCRELY
jgi:hypothetical protein